MAPFRFSSDGQVFIIAEIGVNHNGDLNRAFQLIDAASRAGADAVKFQTFRTENLVSRDAPMAPYQQLNTGSKMSQFDMLKKLELDEKAHARLAEHAALRKMRFLSTPHSGPEDVDLLERIGVDMYKVGSADITNPPLLRKVANTKKPVLLSTGMATLDEVKTALDLLVREGCSEVILLQCTSLYPCPPSAANLRCIPTFKKTFGRPVGFSDHTEGTEAAVLATRLGAVCIEKHVTIDRNLPGPDHKASMEPEPFAHYVSLLRTERAKGSAIQIEPSLETMLLGSGEKRPTEEERKTSLLVRKSIVARQAIARGETLAENSLAVRRPASGIPASEWDRILGRKVRRNVASGMILSWDDLQ